jgi:hypothetical protein
MHPVFVPFLTVVVAPPPLARGLCARRPARQICASRCVPAFSTGSHRR